MNDLYITWENYHRSIEQLAITIYQSGWSFNQIVCLAKGGLRVGDILARLYHCPLAVLAATSYGGNQYQKRGSLVLGEHLAMTTLSLGSHVLVVDDLVDSGITLGESLAWIDRHYGDVVQEKRTAVLWYKACSQYQPDYYVDYLPHNPWIHQPFEQYERTGLEELLQQRSS